MTPDPDELSGLLRAMARRAGSYRRAYKLIARDPGLDLGGTLLIDDVAVTAASPARLTIDSAGSRWFDHTGAEIHRVDIPPAPAATVAPSPACDCCGADPVLGQDLVDAVTRLLGPVYGQDPDDLHGGHADTLRDFMQRNAHQVIARLAELGLHITRSQT